MSLHSYKELLAKFGAINMLPNNPFYILGLPCEASSRQIRRRREDLDAAHELGTKCWNTAFPYLLKGSAIPSFEEVKEAFARLEDLEERVVASFFWFWSPPGNDRNILFDDAYHSFVSGDYRKAEEIWKSMADFKCYETRMLRLPNGIHLDGRYRVANVKCRQSVSARHNLLVLYKLQAILWELQEIQSNEEKIPSVVKALNNIWEASSERIEPIYGSHYVYVNKQPESELGLPEGSWSLFKEKILELDDARLSEDVLSAFKLAIHDIPIMWHANFIRDYARKDRWNEVDLHIRLAGISTANHVISENILDVVFDGMREDFRVKIQRLDQKVKDTPSSGLVTANELIDITEESYRIICAFLGDDKANQELLKVKRKLLALKQAPKGGQKEDVIVPHEGSRRLFCFDGQGAREEALKREIQWRESYLRLKESLYDPIVKACFNFIFKYSEATKDWGTAIKWDEFLSELAVSEKLRKTINDDLRSIFCVRVNELMDKYGIQVKNNAKNGVWAASQLLEDAKYLIVTIETRYGVVSDFAKSIKNQIAGACRNFSIAYCNATKDWLKGIQSLNAVRGLISDPIILGQFKSDMKVLKENQALKEEEDRCWVCHGHSNVKDHIITMHGNVTQKFLSEHVSWQIITIPIRLCSKCRFRYYGAHLLVLPVSIGLCVLIGLIRWIIADVSNNGQGDKGYLSIGIGFGAILAFVIYWLGIIRWLWFRKHPRILEARKKGFSFGEKPFGVE